MPAIYQRLRYSFRRRPHQHLRGPSAVVRTTTRQEQHTADLSDDEDEVLDDGRNSPSPLPVMTDRGPPTSNRYGNGDLFWNSTMHEADKHDKSWLPPSRPGKLQPEDEYTGRSRLPRHGFVRGVPPSAQPGTAQEHMSKLPAPRAAAARRKMDTSYANRNAERKISYGRERADNDLTVMYYAAPGNSYAPSIPSHQGSPSIPYSPPVDDHPDVQPNSSPLAHLVEPQQPESPMEEPPSTSNVSTGAGEHQPTNIVHAYHMPNPSSLSFSTLPNTLAWSRALSQILRNDFVDPDMKRRVRERIKMSNTTNGNGEAEHFHVAPVEAGLVPNFSYPVAGSAFYDRHVADAPEDPDPDDQATEEVVGEQSTVQHPAPTDIEQQGFDFGFGPSETHGVSSHSVSSLTTNISTSSNESTSPTTLLSHQPHYGDKNVSNHLNTLFAETLSASQLNLLNAILSIPPNTPASSPTLFRLTHSLHALLLHLQDRAEHMEDNLLPQLGTALERKTQAIDVLALETQTLGEQITKLKATVDFSSKILSGCWVRNWEMWHTLTGIRKGRRRGWWDFRRATGPEGALASDSGQRFSGRELDALVMIAEQNVAVLREDVEDLVDKVEGCKRAFVARPAEVEPEEGSWRDV